MRMINLAGVHTNSSAVRAQLIYVWDAMTSRYGRVICNFLSVLPIHVFFCFFVEHSIWDRIIEQLF